MKVLEVEVVEESLGEGGARPKCPIGKEGVGSSAADEVSLTRPLPAQRQSLLKPVTSSTPGKPASVIFLLISLDLQDLHCLCFLTSTHPAYNLRSSLTKIRSECCS